MIYFICLIFFIIFAIQFDYFERKEGGLFAWVFSFLTCVFISGLRYKVGGDTFVYMYGFEDYPSFSEFSTFNFSEAPYEIAWYILSALCKLISDSFFFFQFVHAFLINLVFFRTIKKYTKFKFTGLVLYFIFGFLYFNMEIMRESLAVCVFLLALSFYYEKKWVKYYLSVGVACLFHTSALLLVIFPFFSQIKLSKAFLFSFLVILSCSGLLWKLFYEYIFYFNFIDSIDRKIDSYLSNLNDLSFTSILWSILTFFGIPFLFVLYAFSLKDKSYKESPFIWLFLFFGILTMFNITIFTRFQNYLFFPFLIFISNMIYKARYLKQTQPTLFPRRVVFGILLILMFISRYYGFFDVSPSYKTSLFDRYFPYQSIFTENNSPNRQYLELLKK